MWTRVVLQQFRKLMRRVEALTGGNRDVDAARHLGGGVDLGVVGRLLEPGRLELGDVVADPDGLRDAEAAVPLDHDLDIGTDGLAHRANDIERELAVTGGHRPPGRAKRVEFERLIAASDDLRGPLGKALRGARTDVPTVGVGGQVLVIATAEKVVDRSARHLADDVPASLFDGGNRVAVDLAAVGVEVAGHALIDGLDLERVHPFVTRSQLVDGSLDGPRERVERALADAVEPWLVSVEPDEEPVLPGISDDIRRRASDLHVPSRRVGCAA